MVDRILVDEYLLSESEGTVDIQPLFGALEVDVSLVVACCDDVCNFATERANCSAAETNAFSLESTLPMTA